MNRTNPRRLCRVIYWRSHSVPDGPFKTHSVFVVAAAAAVGDVGPDGR